MMCACVRVYVHVRLLLCLCLVNILYDALLSNSIKCSIAQMATALNREWMIMSTNDVLSLIPRKEGNTEKISAT